MDYIENLKGKPEHIRRRFAFLVSFSFTFLVFAGWIASYGFVPSKVAVKSPSNINKEKITAEAPVSTLTATAMGAWTDIKSMFSGSNKVEFTNDSIEVIPGNR